MLNFEIFFSGVFYSLVTGHLAASDRAAGAIPGKSEAPKIAAAKTAEAEGTDSNRANGTAACC